MRAIHRSLAVLGIVVGVAACASAWVTTVSAQGVSVDAASDQQKAEAGKRFTEAKKHYDAKRFDQALAGFRSSYDIVASPNTIVQIARALQDMGNLEEAYTTFVEAERVAREAVAKDPKYNSALEVSQKELADLRKKVTLVTLSVSGAIDGTEVRIDDTPFAPDLWGKERPMRIGEYQITATAPGKPQFQEVIKIVADSPPLTIDLGTVWAPASASDTTEPTERKSGFVMDQKKWSYVAGGVGVAGVLTFGIFGIMNNKQYGDLKKSCMPYCTDAETKDGRTYQTVANVGLVVGVVGLGAGAALYLTADSKKKDSSTQVGVGPGSVTVRGSF